jgi:hypothetical protein
VKNNYGIPQGPTVQLSKKKKEKKEKKGYKKKKKKKGFYMTQNVVEEGVKHSTTGKKKFKT